MAKQLHKKFSDIQIKELIIRYIEVKYKENISKSCRALVKPDFLYCLKNTGRNRTLQLNNYHDFY